MSECNAGIHRWYGLALAYADAARLCFVAQCIESKPVPDTLARMLSISRGSQLAMGDLTRIASRASRAMSVIAFRKNTCLTRAMVFCALARTHTGLQLHIGFQSGDQEDPTTKGHAWVSRGGIDVYSSGRSSNGKKYICSSTVNVDNLK